MRALSIPKAPGTYALVFHVSEEMRVPVGRLGWLHLWPGVYAYVGSARGPGGLAARVRRHLQRTKTPHWHIDYLTTSLLPTMVLFTTDPHVTECAWVQQWLQENGTFVPLKGMGNGDCRKGCPAHFVGLDGLDRVETPLERWGEVSVIYVKEVGR